MMASGRAALTTSGRISGSGLASARISGLVRHLRQPFRLQHIGRRQAQKDIGAGQHFAQGAGVGLAGIARHVGRHVVAPGPIDHALDVGEGDIVHRQAHRHQQIDTGQRRRARARRHQLDLGQFLALQHQPVADGGGADDGGAVLVVMEDRNLHPLAQLLLDDETFRRLDVFQIDAAEGGLQRRHDVARTGRRRWRPLPGRRHRCRRIS